MPIHLRMAMRPTSDGSPPLKPALYIDDAPNAGTATVANGRGDVGTGTAFGAFALRTHPSRLRLAHPADSDVLLADDDQCSFELLFRYLVEEPPQRALGFFDGGGPNAESNDAVV